LHGRSRPEHYHEAGRDYRGVGACAPDEKRFFAKRINATTTELDTSHVPMLSKPKEVLAVIMKAAAKASH
jgi:hypothetical protein